MPAEGRENPLLKKGNSDAFFREKYLTKNTDESSVPDYFRSYQKMGYNHSQLGTCLWGVEHCVRR